MKHAVLFPVFAVAMFAATATASEPARHAFTIQTRCNEMQTKVLAGDFEGAQKFLYPRLVGMVGGPDKMTSYLKQGAAMMHEMGATLTCSAPTQFSQVGSRSFALLPVLLSAHVVDKARGNRHFKQSSSMLAISENNGASWFFMAVTDQGVPDVLIPGGIGKFSIPPKDGGAFFPE